MRGRVLTLRQKLDRIDRLVLVCAVAKNMQVIRPERR